MNNSAKHAIQLVLEFASLIGALYGFWKSHESEIQEIVSPIIDHCLEIQVTNGGDAS